MLATLKPWLYGVTALALVMSGMRMEAWREAYGRNKAIEAQARQVNHVDTQTQTHTQAAAFNIQTTTARSSRLQDHIQTTDF